MKNLVVDWQETLHTKTRGSWDSSDGWLYGLCDNEVLGSKYVRVIPKEIDTSKPRSRRTFELYVVAKDKKDWKGKELGVNGLSLGKISVMHDVTDILFADDVKGRLCDYVVANVKMSWLKQQFEKLDISFV